MSALSELLLQHLPEGWSARRVAREAQQRGLILKESTATAYFGSRHGSIPSERVLQALAEVLSIDIAELRRAAGLPVGENVPYAPPAEAARLSQRQRLALDELIRAVVGADRQEEPHATEVQEPQQGQGSSTRRGAGRTGAPMTPPSREAARRRQKSAVERAKTAGHPNAEELAELDQLGGKAHSTSHTSGDGTERDR